MSRLADTERFLIEDLDYGYYLAKPEGEFRDAFENSISYEILFQADKAGNVTICEVCETGIWGNLYWSEKKKNYPQSRILFKKLREQVQSDLKQEKAA